MDAVTQKRSFLRGDNVELAQADHEREPAPARSRGPKTAAKANHHFRVLIRLHSDIVITRDVATRPDVREIPLAGWYEERPDGDIFAIAYDAIATIDVRRIDSPLPAGAVGVLQ